MKLNAIGTRVLVQMDPRENELNGIIIPDAYLYRESIGTVISTGDYVDLVEPGDRVLLKQCCGVDVVIDGCEFSIVTEDDVLGIVEEITAENE
ncbi:MAG: co-chaperone GroES [Candidatus Auribacter fodinae]|jgi:co-chaperonin GroES (HSP10)|uniref:10 kDa chaperonin n=1 Tax=Candidatus Auribacter fodinae TaxID=2093366 RepID=A0A3A4QZU2_9BACT|nr:MAG: co-chaperone GroES [Candidatus Auribacter fodinae]